MTEVFITCAVTGAGDTVGKSDQVPFTPEAIARNVVAAAQAGAAIAHIHVRDPITGDPDRQVAYYQEVVERVRASSTDVIINLTAGMGGDLVIGSVENPLPLDSQQTDLAGATERLDHVRLLRPEICTLDCGTMNFGEGNYVATNTHDTLAEMARQIQQLDVRPEIEIFDTGQLWEAKSLVDEGLIDSPVMVQLCMGVKWGAPNDLNTFMAMVNNVPDEWTFSAFSLGRDQLPYVALAAVAGGNVRVGLEDNLYLDRGNLATNENLTARAKLILESMNFEVIGPKRVREMLQLTAHNP
ncbi:MAG: 3-keto-5-aminohexanoate cleavage protein [Actinomycetota bacterium]|jgi:uncharacterized protein (DUF849 family)|nr:3-keto-5-aminohexanoate cleavage protein [Actinomycetota bacterium]|tara:strand:- start:16514 stop:17407 length:894 start_codon:yes stop_codon:yes gene_type:complete